MHALIENGAVKQYPYGVAQLKAAHPSTSFPASVNDATLAEYGVERVFFSTPPVIDEQTQALEEDPPVFNGERWTQVWRVRDLTAEEVAARVEAKAGEVRAERNARLTASDWTQGKDIPDSISQPWSAYRQALRDLPQQSGFPWSVAWPAQPE